MDKTFVLAFLAVGAFFLTTAVRTKVDGGAGAPAVALDAGAGGRGGSSPLGAGGGAVTAAFSCSICATRRCIGAGSDISQCLNTCAIPSAWYTPAVGGICPTPQTCVGGNNTCH